MTDPTVQMLLVEDDAARANLARRAMAGMNLPIDLKIFERAEDAIEYLNQAYMSMQSVKPDVLITDIRLPGMSGHDLIKLIRSNVRFDELPVAVYSWTPSPNDIELAYKTGANVVLSKLDMGNVVRSAVNLINPQKSRRN
jgi:CheY-like chemotaxis protein